MSELELGTHEGCVEVYTCTSTDEQGTTHVAYGIVCELLDIMVCVPCGPTHDLLDQHFPKGWDEGHLLDVLSELLISAWADDEPNVVAVNWNYLLDRKLVGEVRMKVEAQPITLH